LGWYTQGHFEAIALAKISGEPMPELKFDIETFKQSYRDHRKRAA
jgi:hypothetical protein